MVAEHAKNDRGEALSSLVIAVGIASLIVAVLATSVLTTLSSTSTSTTSLYESNDAQLVANYFSTDVQTMAQVTTTDCDPAAGEARVFAIEQGDGGVVAYYEDPAATSLTRRVCDSVGTVNESNTIALGLSATSPTVTCDGAACLNGMVPDEIRITVTEGSGFVYDLVGSRRYIAGSGALESWRFVVLGSGSGVVSIGGGPSTLDVNGDALITSTSTTWYSGSPSDLTIVGTTTQAPAPDPLAALPHPTGGALPVYTDGQYHGPGIYRNLQLSINSSITMAPGTYILEEGMRVQSSSVVSGTDVFLFNGCAVDSPMTCANNGAMFVSGSALLQLEAPTAGPYRNILFFQHRNNTATATISGSTQITSIAGAVYAADATVVLGSGSAGMDIGAVIAKEIVVQGGAGITVGA